MVTIRIANTMVHLMIWTLFNTCMVKITLNQTRKKRWSLSNNILAINVSGNTTSSFSRRKGSARMRRLMTPSHAMQLTPETQKNHYSREGMLMLENATSIGLIMPLSVTFWRIMSIYGRIFLSQVWPIQMRRTCYDQKRY